MIFKILFKKEFDELQKLKEENKKLKKENKKLKAINSFKDDIISAISHEFKNPISIINGYIETIIDSELDKNTQKRFLNKIYKNANRLSELLDRLYLVTKLKNKALRPNFTNFRLDLLIKEISENYENRINLNLKEISVYADKDLLEIVLTNLISNALKYSNDEITINLNEKFLEVIDKGIGIEEDKIKLITKKFYRISNDWDNSLGLGLYIVKKILKMHNTKLEIESKKGRGSKFYFEITSLTNKEFLQQ
jgi:signal transduction histidine kinase